MKNFNCIMLIQADDIIPDKKVATAIYTHIEYAIEDIRSFLDFYFKKGYDFSDIECNFWDNEEDGVSIHNMNFKLIRREGKGKNMKVYRFLVDFKIQVMIHSKKEFIDILNNYWRKYFPYTDGFEYYDVKGIDFVKVK